MARKKTGFFEDLFEIAFKLPWWVGVIAAAITFAIFHFGASTELPKITGTHGLGNAVVEQVWITLASVLQWLVPFALLVGAAASAIKQRERGALHADVARSSNSSAILDLSWRDFEHLVGEAFRLKGFKVEETGRASADGGVDLVLRRGAEKHLVQCKQWRASKVGVSIVRELYGVMAAEGAAGGYVVTSGVFTRDADKFAEGRNIELVDGAQLWRMIQSAQSSLRTHKSATPISAPTVTPTATPVEEVEMPCPRCHQPMIRRIAKQGAHAGKAFWGCSAFPQCRGTKPID